jgi:hypothetical protein
MWGTTVRHAIALGVSARASRANAVAVRVRASEARGASRICGGRGELSDDPASPVCPACGKSIPNGAAVGGTPDRVLHLDCYIAERDKKRPLKRAD